MFRIGQKELDLGHQGESKKINHDGEEYHFRIGQKNLIQGIRESQKFKIFFNRGEEYM